MLVQTAKIIKNLFRSEDVVGRIGGEEFIVLMKGTTDLDIIHYRCNQLNDSLQSMFGSQMPDCKPSCSADQALYYAKANGKRQYALYSSSMTDGTYSLRHADYDENMLRGYIDF